jgi:nitrogen fixation protein NifB
MALDTTRHPCFNDSARHHVARVHLPVAPDCNVQCSFCKRMYDCANESRPGVTSAVLTPSQAVDYLEKALHVDPRIAVVGIAGPGDPFATPATTLETLRLVREKYADLLLCVASNGLSVAAHADALAAVATSHVTLTVNAVEPEIGARIYLWVRHAKHVYRGTVGAQLLWERQAEAIRALKARGMTIKINTIVIPGVNDRHVTQVAQRVAELGADVLNCVPVYPVAGTPLSSIDPPGSEQMETIRAEAGKYLPLMRHCTRCRADAVGLLGEPVPPQLEVQLRRSAALPLNAREERPYVAVATLEGVLVNQHLGEALEVSIFAPQKDGFQLVGRRETPPVGGGTQRWHALAKTLADCRALLVASAGQSPCSVLNEQGIQVIMMEGLVEEGLNAVYGGLPMRAPPRKPHRCGSGCEGNGMGCG